VVLLPTDSLHRQRRAAPAPGPATPAESTPVVATTQNLKNQYQSISSNLNVSSAGGDATVTTVDSSKLSGNTGSVTYNVHNVGVNGTGQRKDLTSNVDGGSNSTNGTTSINVSAVPASGPVPASAPVPAAGAGAQPNPPKKTPLAASQPSQFPKKTVASSSSPGVQVSTTTERSLIDEVDVPEEVITNGSANQTLKSREDHFDYYRSLLYVSKDETASLWSKMRTIPENNMLSSSHRRAMTVELKFDFPFYGHFVRNITVATGGFLYTGEYVHSWLAATQYIAPLMANFDTSLADDSFVRLLDNGKS